MTTTQPLVVLSSRNQANQLVAVLQHYRAWTASFLSAAARAGAGAKVEQRVAQLDSMLATLQLARSFERHGEICELAWLPVDVDLSIQACDSYVERLQELQCIADLVGGSADDPNAIEDLQQLVYDVGALREDLLQVSRSTIPFSISRFFGEESKVLAD